MKRSRARTATLIPALAGLLASLLAPALHGSLSHAHPCSDAQAHCLDVAGASQAPATGAEVCSLCMATARSRSAVAPPPTLASPVRGSVQPPVVPRAATALPSSPWLLRAAPRAPPVCA